MAWALVSLWFSQRVALLSCMGASLLLFVAPPHSKVVEEMLLQLALWMYVDKEANLFSAIEVSELSVEGMWLFLLLWWWLWLLLWFCTELYPLICSSEGREVEGNPLRPILFSPVIKTRLHLFISAHT